jgi:hypothetical protein
MSICEGFLRGTLFPVPICVPVPETARVAVVQVDSFHTKGDKIPRVDTALCHT